MPWAFHPLAYQKTLFRINEKGFLFSISAFDMLHQKINFVVQNQINARCNIVVKPKTK